MEKQNIVYSVPINNSDRKENESSVYVTKMGSLNDQRVKNVSSIQSLLNERLKRPNEQLLGERVLLEDSNGKKVLDNQYTWLTTMEVFDKARLIGKGMMGMNLAP
jgi:hypothetical protein